MRKGHGRLLVAVTLLATLLVPAAGSLADPQEELEEVRSELNEVQDQIDNLENTAGDLKTSIEALNEQIAKLRDIVTKYDRKIVQKQIELHGVRSRIEATEAKIDALESRAQAQAIALYKAGATDTIDALLTAKSLSELDARAEMLGTASQENTGFLIRYGRLKVEIEDHYEEEYAIQEQLQATRNANEEMRQELQGLYVSHAAKLAKVEEKLGEAHRHEKLLDSEAAKLSEKIRAAQAAAAPAPAAVQSFAPSGSGYIWPINGSVTSYFGPRWGRMHEGIDIDGSTGQPIAASKAGRVILAGYSSGYGNSVVVDHGGGVATLYAHMTAIGVSQGQVVSQGQTLGTVGCTGSCTGPHLHFEVQVNGVPHDPLGYLP